MQITLNFAEIPHELKLRLAQLIKKVEVDLTQRKIYQFWLLELVQGVYRDILIDFLPFSVDPYEQVLQLFAVVITHYILLIKLVRLIAYNIIR